MAAGTYSFKGTADMSQHDASIKKSTEQVKNYENQVKKASKESDKLSKTDFGGAYKSQKRLNDGVKGFTNAMNGASRGIMGMIGKAGIWGAAIAASIGVGKKAMEEFRKVNAGFDDDMGRLSASFEAQWTRALQKISNWDFSNLRASLADAAKTAQELYDASDRKNTYNFTANADIARVQNDINELRNQIMENENAIKKKQKEYGKDVDVKEEQKAIDDLNAQISKKIDELGKIFKTQQNLAENEAVKGMNAAGLSRGELSRMVGEATEGMSDEVKKAFNEIYQQTMGGSKENQFRFLTTDVEDQYLTDLQRAIVSAISGNSVTRGTYGYGPIGNPNTSISGQQVLVDLGYFGQSNKNNATQSDIDREKAMYAFINMLNKLTNNMGDAADGVIDRINKSKTDAENARGAAINQRAQQLQDERRRNRTNTPTYSGPVYKKDTIGWYEKEIQKLQEKIKKSTDHAAVEGFEKSIKDYQDKINKIKMGADTLPYIQSQMKEISDKIQQTTDINVKKQLQNEYNELADKVLNLQWPVDSPQWIEGKIKNLQRKFEETTDLGLRRSIQGEIDAYNVALNNLTNANNAIGRVQGELRIWQDKLSRATDNEVGGINDNIRRLNHEINNLQNKKGSINWLTTEINLLTQELNETDAPEEINRITNEVTRLRGQLMLLQRLTEKNIVIKTDLDLKEEQLQRFSDAANGVVNGLHIIGNAFNDFATIKQGSRQWDELTEAEQRQIEQLENMAIVWNGLTDVLDNIINAYTAWQDALNTAARAAETTVIQQQNAALAENTSLKQQNAAAAAEEAVSVTSETLARTANTTATEAEGVAAVGTANAKTAEAVASGTAGAAKVPFPASIAAIAAIMAALGSVIAMVASLTSKGNKYAEGGIVGGSSFAGDRIIAHVNSGEMILNRRQQTRLFDLLNGSAKPSGNNPGGAVTFHISGTDLVGVLDNQNRKFGRIK